MQQGDTYSAQKQVPDKVMMAACCFVLREGWRETRACVLGMCAQEVFGGAGKAVEGPQLQV